MIIALMIDEKIDKKILLSEIDDVMKCDIKYDLEALMD
jgi:hypothetical protein